MKNELYINGTKCDLPNGYTLPLKWQSNIFGDLSKIVGNKSATITLPFTPTNRSIFAIAEVPATGGAKARQKLPARCVIDGVQIFEDGYAVLLSASDGYEVALTWGVITNYDALVGDDTTLDNATWWDFGGENSIVKLVDMPDFNSTLLQTSWRWLMYYSDVFFSTSANVPAVLPSVMVRWVLRNIGNHYGISFDIPYSRDTYLDDLAIMLTGARIIGDEETLQGKIRLSSTDYSNNSILNSARFILKASTDYGGCIQFTSDCTISVTKTLTYSQPFEIWWWNYRTGENVPDVTAVGVYDSDTNRYNATLVIEDYEVQKGDEFIMSVVEPDGGGGYSPIYYVGEDVIINIKSDADAEIPDYMAIVPNLPRLTAVEFLKDIMLHAGVFAVNTSTPNTLKFVTAEQFQTDSTQVLPDPISAANVSWSYGDFSQKNELVHTTDDGGENEGKGILYVNDDTLPVTNEMYKSPFGLLYSYNYLHLYEQDDNGTWSYLHPAERLGKMVGTFGVADESVSFADVIANRMPLYQGIVYEPTLVKCTIHMTLLEVVNLDFARSVYINKFGRRYAIVSIEMTAKDTFTFELIQIPA